MAYNFFMIPTTNSDSHVKVLNAFLNSHAIVHIDRRFVDCGENSHWVLAIEYISSYGGNSMDKKVQKRNRVEYKEILTSEEFKKYEQLREWRKKVADAESVPLYAILNNEHIADIVRSDVKTKSDLTNIKNIGEAKMQKYGDSIFAVLHSPDGVPF